MGVEAVLGDGSVVSHLAGLPKDNTGYDLAGLLTGSEGTLGVITAARLRLVPRLDHRVTAGLGFRDIAAAVDAVIAPAGHAPVAPRGGAGAGRGRGPGRRRPRRRAATGAALAGRPDRRGGGPERSAGGAGGRRGRPRPGGRARRRRDRRSSAGACGSCGRASRTPSTASARRSSSTSRSRSGGPRTSSTPLPEVLPGGLGVVVFGHLGDGNLHVNVTGVAPTDPTLAQAVEEAVLRRSSTGAGASRPSTASARPRPATSSMGRSPAEIAAFRAIKAALDPHGILNPGAVLPPG